MGNLSILRGALASAQVSTYTTGSITLPSARQTFIPPGDFQSISSFTAVGGETTITLSSIPATFKHLQLRCIAKDTYSASNGSQALGVRFNSDSGANYAAHKIRGNASTVVANGSGSVTVIDYDPIISIYGSPSNLYGAAIIDIHDYSSTTKYKTIRSFVGADNNDTGKVALSSGVWQNTAAITSISISGFISACDVDSTFALYGIKG